MGQSTLGVSVAVYSGVAPGTPAGLESSFGRRLRPQKGGGQRKVHENMYCPQNCTELRIYPRPRL